MQVAHESVSYKYDFLKYRHVGLGLSLTYIIIGIVAYFMMGGFEYHIDFTGGAEIQVSFEKNIDDAQLRSFMSSHGWGDASIQSAESAKGKKSFLIRMKQTESFSEKELLSQLESGFSDNVAKIENIQWIGPEVGKETTQNAIIAILLSLVILLLYIAARFEFRFGMGAVVSLVHDVLAILVFLLVTREPFSLHILASILAVLGYSLNDTIVIFSKIRENMRKLKGVSEIEIVNLSINQTLSRTILTTGATLLAVAAMLALGGESLRGMSLVMFIGIIVGAYSSVYIANPMMLAASAIRSK